MLSVQFILNIYIYILMVFGHRRNRIGIPNSGVGTGRLGSALPLQPRPGTTQVTRPLLSR